MDRKDVFEYVKKQYGTVPEYLWKESPESAVLRHKNGKWYAVLMQVKKSKLELEGEGTVDIINVKCEPDMVGVLIETYGFLPGYHMNKEHWITMLMDGTVSEAKILDFLDMSYDLMPFWRMNLKKNVQHYRDAWKKHLVQIICFI